jgi:hypothetical protein
METLPRDMKIEVALALGYDFPEALGALSQTSTEWVGLKT